MHKLLLVLLSFLFSIASGAQNGGDWQSLSQLKPGDTVHLSLATGKSFSAPFQSWTAQDLTVGTTIAKKEEVREVDRYSKGEWSSGKRALLGAVIGFGGGAAIGGGVCAGKCFGQAGEAVAVVGGVGAAAGALVGALLPHHKDVIYTAK